MRKWSACARVFLAACNATHNLTERLARWLLRVRDVTGSDTFVLTQEFIAEMLGVRRTSVSITAHQLQAGGIISYKPGHISIDTHPTFPRRPVWREVDLAPAR